MTRVRDAFPRRVREIEHCWIPLSDGCRLAARIWLPEDAEADPVPAILEYIPYRKRDNTAAGDALTHPYFAGHGYAAVRVDLRGSGDSDGLLRDEYLKQEQDDALEVLAWLAAQPWCTGAVGMIGISWGGFNSLQVAARRPPQLKAIVTCCSTDDRYADDVHYMGGCLLLDGVSWGSGLQAFLARPPDPEISGPEWREKWLARLRDMVLPVADWLRHQRRDDYWRHGSVCEDYGRIQCAVYAVGGWADGYSNAVLRLMQHLRGPRKALIGPWTHTYPHFGRPEPAIGFLQECLRWWDHWLKGIDTGIMAEPMLRLWMQEDLRPDARNLTVGGRWIAEPSWPPPIRGIWPLHLTAQGLADRQGDAIRLDICSPQTTGLDSGEWCPLDSGGDGPEFQTDQREDDGKSLLFDSVPLTERVEILGPPVLELELNVDKPVAMLVARLCDVRPDGTSARVTYGLLNLTHRDGHAAPKPLPSGRIMLTFTLCDTAYAFLPGHRIRLALSTCYWPMAWPAPAAATVGIHCAGSRMVLPVRAPKPEDDKLAPFLPAETSPSLRITQLQQPQAWRTISRDLGAGEALLTHHEDRGIRRLDDIGLELGYVAHEVYRIAESDPLCARTDMERTILYRRRDAAIRIETQLTLTSTKDDFDLKVGVQAFENDKPVAQRDWHETIPRDLV